MLVLALPAFALDIDAGLGAHQLSDDFDVPGIGLHAFGRVAVDPRVAVEVGTGVRLAGNEVSGLTQTLLVIAHDGNPDNDTFQVPVRRELATVELLAEASPWKRRAGEKLSVWVYGAGGVVLRMQREDLATYNDAFDSDPSASPHRVSTGDTTTVLLSPALGLGFDLWVVDRVGARVLWLERVAVQEEPDFGNLLPNGEPEPLETLISRSSAVHLDLMVTF